MVAANVMMNAKAVAVVYALVALLMMMAAVSVQAQDFDAAPAPAPGPDQGGATLLYGGGAAVMFFSIFALLNPFY